ncbi:MAG TPA: GNAT family N-acetyltransferase [Jatrophihabitans sp.]|nr:GNAT family N-acetyltransferase [Jatrophihabitans sp.]
MRIVRAGQADWQLVRAARLRSLAADPSAFGSTLQRELAFTDAEWQDRLRTATWFLALPDPAADPPPDPPPGQPADPTPDPAADPADPADPVGVTLIRPLTGENADFEINAMWVAPELRGQRIGEALLGAALAGATEAGARTVRLWVTVGNTGAAALYTRYGFKPTGRSGPLHSDGQLTCAEYLLAVG